MKKKRLINSLGLIIIVIGLLIPPIAAEKETKSTAVIRSEVTETGIFGKNKKY